MHKYNKGVKGFKGIVNKKTPDTENCLVSEYSFLKYLLFNNVLYL